MTDAARLAQLAAEAHAWRVSWLDDGCVPALQPVSSVSKQAMSTALAAARIGAEAGAETGSGRTQKEAIRATLAWLKKEVHALETEDAHVAAEHAGVQTDA
ncbi:hypothetical protein EON68_03030, partial [archaeon]